MRYSGPIADIHNHTDYSPLDGLQTPAEAIARGVELEHPAMAITDHGTNTGQPQFQHEASKAGIKPLLGIEAYFQPDRLERPAEGDKAAMSRLWGGQHLVLLAMDNDGLKDMWAASSEAYATGHYHRPRMDWDLLERYGSKLIATTACLGGVVNKDLVEGWEVGDRPRMDRALDTLERLHSIFGDRLYLEIQANELHRQMHLNKMLADAGAAYGIPLVLANDAHYSSPGQAELHRLWMACQSGKNKEDYWHFSPILGIERIRELTAYMDPDVVDRALANTMVIAERCNAKIDAHFDPPVFGASAQEDSRQLLAMCRSNWDRIRDPSREHLDRLEREFETVASKRMAGCYLMVEEITTWVRGQGWLVGPGRGSAAGSLMSYLLGITSMDPIPARLLFERFLTPGRASLPDFDLDFASSKRDAIQKHVVGCYGSDHVVRVGTIMRYGIRGILNKLFSVMEDRLPAEAVAEGNQISRIIEDAEVGTAGLGLPIDEMMEEPALQPYIEKYASVFDRALELVDRVYAYGKHPAGLIISPQVALTGVLPTRSPAGELAVAEVDYRVADEMGLFKLDLLTVATLDKVQDTIELVERNYGIRLDPRAWRAEHGDPQVWEEIGTGLTLGMFQIETSLCRDYCARMKPSSLDDLADLTTFIRPGPRNSGATESYLRRRAGAEEVTYPHPLLEEALRGSQGVMLYQEDILRVCRLLAGYDDLEADGVRKILGKKLTEKIAAAGEEFVRRCVERGHDEEQVRDLWSKMAEFGKYAFNRAHGFSYATMSYWTAWLKVHYPVEMITATLGSLIGHQHAVVRMAEFTTEARRMGITVLPPSVVSSSAGFTMDGLTVRYGLRAIKGMGPAKVGPIIYGQPYLSVEDFRARSGADAGALYDLARAGALDELAPSRRGLIQVIEADRSGDSVRCVHKAAELQQPYKLPCYYDWDGEPKPPPRYGKPDKNGNRRELKVIIKPPPKICSKACRRYTPPEQLDMGRVPEYDPAALFRMDWEIYKTWMSEAPFALLDEFSPGLREQARQIGLMLPGAPHGHHTVAAIYAARNPRISKKGSKYWWVTLVTEVSKFDVTCFSPRDDRDRDVPMLLDGLRPGQLVGATVSKGQYMAGASLRTSWNLADIWPMGE